MDRQDCSLRPYLFSCQPTKVVGLNVRTHLLRQNFSRTYRSFRSGPMSLLAYEIDVRSVLHGQVSLAAVNQIYVIFEAMNGHKNLKIH